MILPQLSLAPLNRFEDEMRGLLQLEELVFQLSFQLSGASVFSVGPGERAFHNAPHVLDWIQHAVVRRGVDDLMTLFLCKLDNVGLQGVDVLPKLVDEDRLQVLDIERYAKRCQSVCNF